MSMSDMASDVRAAAQQTLDASGSFGWLPDQETLARVYCQEILDEQGGDIATLQTAATNAACFGGAEELLGGIAADALKTADELGLLG